MAKETTATTTDAEKVYNLNVELAQAKLDKKRVSKEYADEVKRIQAEIDEILEAKDNKPKVESE